MTPRRPRSRLTLRLITALAALSLLAAGCSSSGGTTASNSGRSDHGSDSHDTSSHSSDSNRESAERRLEKIGPQLSVVLADYRAGNKTQAYALAKSVSHNLYEGIAEGIVSTIDPAVERQIDSLLAATLPSAIQNGEPVSAVAALIRRAQALAASGLTAIHQSEH